MYIDSWTSPLYFGWPQRLIGRSLTGTPRSVSSMSSALSMLMEASDSAENCILKSWIFFHFPNRALPHFCFPHSGTREGHFTRSSTGAKMCQTVSQSFSSVSLALYFFIAYLDIYTYQIYLHKLHQTPMSIFLRHSEVFLPLLARALLSPELTRQACGWRAVVWNATKQPPNPRGHIF